MSMDFDRTGSDKPITEQEGVMFAAQPVWERNRKRRGFGGRKTASAAPAATVTPEPRTFAAERDYEEPMALDTPLDRPLDRPVDRAIDLPLTDDYGRTVPPSTLAAEPAVERDAGLVAPIGRPTTRTKSKGIGPAAIAAGVVALGAIGAAGWYASRDNDGIPELAPGQPTTSQVATAPLPPVDMPPTMPVPAQTAAVNPPAAAPAPTRDTVRTAPAERRMAQVRTRPAAAAPSAGDTGVNASTTTAIPSGPQPYSTLNPGAAPAPVNPTPAPPPTQAAPPPAENPAAIPATPPTLPTETPPTESPAAIPPTS